MTINWPAAILLAFYIALAEKQGVPRAALRGTVQNDILKEYIAQKEWIFPPEPSMRLVTDMIEFCAARDAAVPPDLDLGLPHPRGGLDGRAGARLHARGRLRVRRVRRSRRGLDVDEFAPRLSFFFNAHIDFFEEIAKYRAARRIWARELRERYGADRRALAAAALPRPDRRGVADGAAAGEQHRADGDPGARGRARRHADRCTRTPWTRRSRCPRSRRSKIALRTQQIIAEETGVDATADPLGGSYFIEALTERARARRPTTTSAASASSAA